MRFDRMLMPAKLKKDGERMTCFDPMIWDTKKEYDEFIVSENKKISKYREKNGLR